MCLSTLLKYSPQTMTRLQNLIKGREAYIMTNMPHIDDLDIAQYLDVPIFAPEPEVAHLYSTKSGSKRIFASANVEMPPSEYDVYSLGLVGACCNYTVQTAFTFFYQQVKMFQASCLM